METARRSRRAICLFVQFFQNLPHLFRRVIIDSVAELAVDENVLAVVNNGLQFLASQTDERPRHAVARAVAAVFDRLRFEDFQIKSVQYGFQYDLTVHSRREQSADCAGVLNAGLDLVNDIVRCTGKQLDDVAACRRDGLILADQNAERTGRGICSLWAKYDVISSAISPETRSIVPTYGSFFHAQIADHSECSVRPDSRADVQLAGCLFQHGNLRVFNPAAHIAPGIRYGKAAPAARFP